MMAKDFLLFATLHFLPYKLLFQHLCKRLSFNEFKFYPQISGRVALYKLALTLKDYSDKRAALIPDFICNVVYMALEKAGYKIQTYPLDDYFEPIKSEVLSKLYDNQIGIFLTASIFGSSAFLDDLKQPEIRELIIKRNIHVIADLCQDINLLPYLPVDYGKNLSAIVSFNDKSFPGIMGGGILSKIYIPHSQRKMSFNQNLSLYKMLLTKFILCAFNSLSGTLKMRYTKGRAQSYVRSLKIKRGYDYSYCRSFPYTIDDLRIGKVQIIMALIGLANLRLINEKKKESLKSFRNILKTKHYDTSPYIVLTSDEFIPNSRRIKAPYAMHNNPDKSLREKLIIVHNKGFCDKG